MSPEPGVHECYEREAYPYFGAIRRAASKLTRQTAEADDLTQEVFLQAWRSFDRYEPGTNCRAWLYQILRNLHYQRLRKRVPEPLGLDGERRLAETLVARDEARENVVDEELRAALAGLSDDHRAIVTLADLEGLTYRELADRLGIPIGTVMSRLSRGRAALRERLAKTTLVPRAAAS